MAKTKVRSYVRTTRKGKVVRVKSYSRFLNLNIKAGIGSTGPRFKAGHSNKRGVTKSPSVSAPIPHKPSRPRYRTARRHGFDVPVRHRKHTDKAQGGEVFGKGRGQYVSRGRGRSPARLSESQRARQRDRNRANKRTARADLRKLGKSAPVGSQRGPRPRANMGGYGNTPSGGNANLGGGHDANYKSGQPQIFHAKRRGRK